VQDNIAHVICMPHVTNEIIDNLIEDVKE